MSTEIKTCFTNVQSVFTDSNMVVLSNFLTPQEGIRLEEKQTTLYINDREVGKGTFYITER